MGDGVSVHVSFRICHVCLHRRLVLWQLQDSVGMHLDPSKQEEEQKCGSEIISPSSFQGRVFSYTGTILICREAIPSRILEISG